MCYISMDSSLQTVQTNEKLFFSNFELAKKKFKFRDTTFTQVYYLISFNIDYVMRIIYFLSSSTE